MANAPCLGLPRDCRRSERLLCHFPSVAYFEHPIVAPSSRLYPPTMNSNIKKLTLLLLGVVVFAFVGTGCNTSKGFGKDVEKLGDKIQEKSR